MLEKALTKTWDGTDSSVHPADLNLGVTGTIPVDYVPEAVVRINLHARLQRLATIEELDDFADEIEDRFGPVPEEVTRLLAIARLALVAGARGIERIDGGPLGMAMTLAKGANAKAVTATLLRMPKSAGERLIYERVVADDIIADLIDLFGTAEGE